MTSSFSSTAVCTKSSYICWREKTGNKDLWWTANQEQVATQILRRKWSWIGISLRKPASNISRQVLTAVQRQRERGEDRGPHGTGTFIRMQISVSIRD